MSSEADMINLFLSIVGDDNMNIEHIRFHLEQRENNVEAALDDHFSGRCAHFAQNDAAAASSSSSHTATTATSTNNNANVNQNNNTSQNDGAQQQQQQTNDNNNNNNLATTRRQRSPPPADTTTTSTTTTAAATTQNSTTKKQPKVEHQTATIHTTATTAANIPKPSMTYVEYKKQATIQEYENAKVAAANVAALAMQSAVEATQVRESSIGNENNNYNYNDNSNVTVDSPPSSSSGLTTTDTAAVVTDHQQEQLQHQQEKEMSVEELANQVNQQHQQHPKQEQQQNPHPKPSFKFSLKRIAPPQQQEQQQEEDQEEETNQNRENRENNNNNNNKNIVSSSNLQPAQISVHPDLAKKLAQQAQEINNNKKKEDVGDKNKKHPKAPPRAPKGKKVNPKKVVAAAAAKNKKKKKRKDSDSETEEDSDDSDFSDNDSDSDYSDDSDDDSTTTYDSDSSFSSSSSSSSDEEDSDEEIPRQGKNKKQQQKQKPKRRTTQIHHHHHSLLDRKSGTKLINYPIVTDFQTLVNLSTLHDSKQDAKIFDLYSESQQSHSQHSSHHHHHHHHSKKQDSNNNSNNAIYSNFDKLCKDIHENWTCGVKNPFNTSASSGGNNTMPLFRIPTTTTTTTAPLENIIPVPEQQHECPCLIEASENCFKATKTKLTQIAIKQHATLRVLPPPSVCTNPRADLRRCVRADNTPYYLLKTATTPEKREAFKNAFGEILPCPDEFLHTLEFAKTGVAASGTEWLFTAVPATAENFRTLVPDLPGSARFVKGERQWCSVIKQPFSSQTPEEKVCHALHQLYLRLRNLMRFPTEDFVKPASLSFNTFPGSREQFWMHRFVIQSIREAYFDLNAAAAKPTKHFISPEGFFTLLQSPKEIFNSILTIQKLKHQELLEQFAHLFARSEIDGGSVPFKPEGMTVNLFPHQRRSVAFFTDMEKRGVQQFVSTNPIPFPSSSSSSDSDSHHHAAVGEDQQNQQQQNQNQQQNKQKYFRFHFNSIMAGVVAAECGSTQEAEIMSTQHRSRFRGGLDSSQLGTGKTLSALALILHHSPENYREQFQLPRIIHDSLEVGMSFTPTTSPFHFSNCVSSDNNNNNKNNNDDDDAGNEKNDLLLIKQRQEYEEHLASLTKTKLQIKANLILLPVSLVGQWKKECDEKTPNLKVLVLHGQDVRQSLTYNELANLDIILVSYETYRMILKEERFIFKWHAALSCGGEILRNFEKHFPDSSSSGKKSKKKKKDKKKNENQNQNDENENDDDDNNSEYDYIHILLQEAGGGSGSNSNSTSSVSGSSGEHQQQKNKKTQAKEKSKRQKNLFIKSFTEDRAFFSRVKFWRIICDEYHKMGGLTNHTELVDADYLWLLSGTPLSASYLPLKRLGIFNFSFIPEDRLNFVVNTEEWGALPDYLDQEHFIAEGNKKEFKMRFTFPCRDYNTGENANRMIQPPRKGAATLGRVAIMTRFMIRNDMNIVPELAAMKLTEHYVKIEFSKEEKHQYLKILEIVQNKVHELNKKKMLVTKVMELLRLCNELRKAAINPFGEKFQIVPKEIISEKEKRRRKEKEVKKQKQKQKEEQAEHEQEEAAKEKEKLKRRWKNLSKTEKENEKRNIIPVPVQVFTRVLYPKLFGSVAALPEIMLKIHREKNDSDESEEESDDDDEETSLEEYFPKMKKVDTTTESLQDSLQMLVEIAASSSSNNNNKSKQQQQQQNQNENENENEEDIIALPQCFLCLDDVSNPVVLACSHIMCRDCLVGWCKEGESKEEKHNCGYCGAEKVLSNRFPKWNLKLKRVEEYLMRSRNKIKKEVQEDDAEAQEKQQQQENENETNLLQNQQQQQQQQQEEKLPTTSLTLHHHDHHHNVDKNYIPTKLLRVYQIVASELQKDPTSKFVIFSSIARLLSPIKIMLENEDITCVLVDGSSSIQQRSSAIERFQYGDDEDSENENDDDEKDENKIQTATTSTSTSNNKNNNSGPRCVIISSRVGNAGLTLTAANHLIICEPSLDAAVDYQSIHRIKRLGQKRAVFVHRLIMEQTIEPQLHDLVLNQSIVLAAPGGRSAHDAARRAHVETLANLLVPGIQINHEKGGGKNNKNNANNDRNVKMERDDENIPGNVKMEAY